METVSLLGNTILFRPYVFVFLAAFLFIGILNHGWERTLVFWFGTWVLAFLSEYSSTRNGFPYGLYHYTGLTKGKELFISNVPFFDSLSYSFLMYASYCMALFTLSPEKQRWKVLILSALYMMMIDVVIDPVALQGERWFLGKIYYYDIPGAFFGIPITNALGWGLVGLTATALYQWIERTSFRPIVHERSWMGVCLYYGVLIFNLTIAWKIGERGLFMAGCFIYLIPTVLLFLKLF